jgi:hypothetical protein
MMRMPWFVRLSCLLLILGVSDVVSARPTTVDQLESAIYRPEPDPRLCPSPLCSGWFVSLVNQSTTVCGDGIGRSHCYDLLVDLEPLGLSEAQRASLVEAMLVNRVLLNGTIEPREPDATAVRGVLHASQAWQGAGLASPNGHLYRVRDNGIRCITAPCFSYDAELMNSSEVTTVSAVDLTGVIAPPEELDAARRLLVSSGLLVAGMIRPERRDGLGAEGRLLVASQFYLPVSASPRESEEARSGRIAFR